MKDQSDQELFNRNFHSWLEDNGVDFVELIDDGYWKVKLDLDKVYHAINRLITQARIDELGRMPLSGSKAVDIAYYDQRSKELESQL